MDDDSDEGSVLMGEIGVEDEELRKTLDEFKDVFSDDLPE